MKYLSVCSGIEAATVAWHDLGWTPVGFSEIEAFPAAVLAHHYPAVPNFGDMTQYQNWNLNGSTISLLVGGTPCQSFSVAGLRKGLHDPRGGLMLTFLEIARDYRPRWVVWENVPGVLSSAGGRDFGSFLGALGELGYGWAYRVLDAQWFGVAQRRRRVFVVGCLGDQTAAAKVLFESESVCRNPAPSREKGKGFAAVAGTLAANGGGLTRPAGNCNEVDFCVPVGQWWDGGQTASTLRAKETANDFTPITLQDRHIAQPIPLNTMTMHGRPSDTGRMGSGVGESGDPCPTLSKAHHHAVAFAQNQLGEVRTGDVLNTLNTNSNASGRNTPMIQTAMQVRRLTPVECERLQGFPDGYTAIPWKKKPAEDCPDGPRYKALGNSMAVPVMRWIGKRIAAQDQIDLFN